MTWHAAATLDSRNAEGAPLRTIAFVPNPAGQPTTALATIGWPDRAGSPPGPDRVASLEIGDERGSVAAGGRETCFGLGACMSGRGPSGTAPGTYRSVGNTDPRGCVVRRLLSSQRGSWPSGLRTRPE